MNTEKKAPSPELYFKTIFAHRESAALKGAIDLELFTAIGEGKKRVPEIAKRCNASERGTRILCDFLVVIGFLTKHGDQYELTQDSGVFLDKRSPAYLGTSTEFLLADVNKQAYSDIAATVRKGGTILPADGNVSPENPVWVKFARSMAPLMTMPAQVLAGQVLAGSTDPMKLLDIAAGHGIFGVTVAQQNPNAKVVAVDWPNVLAVAKENAQKAGVSERYSTIPEAPLMWISDQVTTRYSSPTSITTLIRLRSKALCVKCMARSSHPAKPTRSNLCQTKTEYHRILQRLLA